MTAELVGPLPVVRFRDGAVVAYSPPRDTIDGGRWQACTEHRVACDCREAQMAEEIAELRSQLRAAQEACRYVLAGHATFAWEDGPNGKREIGCQCTGCRIARKAHLLATFEAGPSARDEVDGLSPEQVDFGQRWRVCTPQSRERLGAECTAKKFFTRQRGVFHEHLMEGDAPALDWANCDPEDIEVPF